MKKLLVYILLIGLMVVAVLPTVSAYTARVVTGNSYNHYEGYEGKTTPAEYYDSDRYNSGRTYRPYIAPVKPYYANTWGNSRTYYGSSYNTRYNTRYNAQTRLYYRSSLGNSRTYNYGTAYRNSYARNTYYTYGYNRNMGSGMYSWRTSSVVS